MALVWFLAYCVVRVLSGLWLAPDLFASWWPNTFEWLAFSLPWVWVMFNLLQFPKLRRAGLWTFVFGCTLCASLHLLGIGTSAVDNSIDEVRTTVFGENANVVGATYAVAVIILVGLGMLKDVKLGSRLIILPLIAVVGIGLAKTGSRTAILLVVMGIATLLFQAKSFSSRSARYSALILVGSVLAGTLLLVPTVLERFKNIDPHNPGEQNPRARMAPVLLEIFLRSPILGSGPDRYQVELTRRSMPYLIRDQRTIASHNLVLLLLVETGIVGFLVFSTGLWKALVAAWKARLGSCGYLPLALLLPFCIAGMVVCNPTSDHAFWFVVAYALAGAA